MYNKIKDEISQKYYQDNYPNDGQRFIAWYLRNIHNLDIIEAKSCITDGAGDKQIDAVYIDNETETIYIIQGKFYNKSLVDAEPLREVLSSWVQIKDLKHLQEEANKQLKVKINEIATALEDDYEVCFELIITSELTDSAKADLKAFQRELSENETLSANLLLVDNDTLAFKYDEALNKNRPYINHDFNLENGKYMEIQIGDTNAVIAALPLSECIKIPGIKDGSLFRKNVRQSLGTGNRVNKKIAYTIKNDPTNFFFLHNGITAICSDFSLNNNTFSVKELNVVNGCQSLNTIYNCSEFVRDSHNSYVLFRFYKIVDSEQADNISTSTNSQSAVKARDLRSNDKSVLSIKKSYEQFYPDGYFITKRGETVDTVKYNSNHIVNLVDLGKQLMAWHSQRPTMSYSETKIFDKYFDQLFRKDYSPEKIQALHDLFDLVSKKWVKENPMSLNESLLAMKAYAPYHHLYTISIVFCDISQMPESVPNPRIVLDKLVASDKTDYIVELAGLCLNMAFENANSETIEQGGIFSPQNWIKRKSSLKDIRNAVRSYLKTMRLMPGGKEISDEIQHLLKMSNNEFEERWTAD